VDESYQLDLDKGGWIHLDKGGGCDMRATLDLDDVEDEGYLGDGYGEGTTIDLVNLGDEVDDGGIGTSLYWVRDGVGRGLVLDLLGLGGYDLGVTLDVLESLDGGFEIVLDDRVVVGLGNEG
ncbi:hypothetical protein KI387_023230, partial [Taxus chinensis]